MPYIFQSPHFDIEGLHHQYMSPNKTYHPSRAWSKLPVRVGFRGSSLAMLGSISATGPGPSPTPQIFSWRSMRKRWPCNKVEREISPIPHLQRLSWFVILLQGLLLHT